MFFVIAYFFLDVTFLTQNTGYSIVICGISLGFLIMSILVVYFLGEISFFYQKSNENSILALKNQTLEQQLAFQETSTVEMNKVRHDINKNIANIAYLLKQNDISEAISYINDIVSALESTKAIINSGNRIIDIILNYETAICRKSNIKIETKIDDLPDLKISQVDLTGIVSNMLDNAIEANENMELAERYISIKMFCYKNYLSIIIKNPYAHPIVLEKGLIRTNKDDIFRHGYGLKSIKASAEKYGGNFKFEIQDNIFTAMVILPIEF
jgi:sensor histidine kinase regulating citrate/malate metabolism